MTADPVEFTLTCTSTGGPVTTYAWSRENIEVPEDADHIKFQTLENRKTAEYSLKLTVTGRLLGTYKCLVNTERPQDHQEFSSSQSINIVGELSMLANYADIIVHSIPPSAASEPLGVTAIQETPTTIRVSWTAPTSGAPPTGYRVYYSTESEDQFSHEVMIGASGRGYELTGLQSDLVYRISIMALSEHLPSPVIGPITPGVCTLHAIGSMNL